MVFYREYISHRILSVSVHFYDGIGRKNEQRLAFVCFSISSHLDKEKLHSTSLSDPIMEWIAIDKESFKNLKLWLNGLTEITLEKI